jgi:hypothetical protein
LHQPPFTPTRQHLIFLTCIAWLAMLGVDFFLHASLLAGLYLEPSPFLLPPLSAFALIPVGYAAFLFSAVLLIWLMTRLKLTGWRAGAIFGLQLGSLTWGALALGLASISTASYRLLLGWFIGQTLELAVAGTVVGSGLAGVRLRRLFGAVLLLVVLSVVATIVLQSLSVVPTTRLTS